MATSKASFGKRQTHGALPVSDSKAGKTIYSILNRHKASPYTTSSLPEYKEFLGELSLIQLQDHAMLVGTVIPTDDRNKMIDRLVREFAAYQGKVQELSSASVPQPVKKTKAQLSTEKILSRYSENSR